MSRGIKDSATLTALDQLRDMELHIKLQQTAELLDASKRKRKGSKHGKAIFNPATYEALKGQGFSKSSAAAISNAALNKGYAKGKHSRGK